MPMQHEDKDRGGEVGGGEGQGGDADAALGQGRER